MDKSDDIYQEPVQEGSPEFYCDNCGHYPIEPVHGHFMCPACHMPTKCCEGMPIEG
jgi:Zn finger protein HypA/HybF involved in hydrogenase expression